jgi:hypothetical protein
MMKNVYPLLRLTVAIIISLGAIRPLLSPGFFPMHDDVQPARIVAMSRALREGQFPVRWVSDLGYGYGYPLFNFYAPLPYYVGGLVHLATGDALVATKAMMALGMLLAAVSMYVLAALFLPYWGVLVAVVLYVYAPYHGLQLYVRGAVGELWAYGFLPFILAGVVSLVRGKRRGLFMGAASLTGVILSHTIMGYLTAAAFGVALFGGFVWLWIAKRAKVNKKVLYSLLFMGLLGLGLSAFFWLPAIAEMKFTSVAGQIGGGATLADHFVCARQLWQSAWGYGGSAAGCTDGMAFKLGKVHILLAVLGVLLFLKRGGTWKPDVRLVGIVAFALLGASLFLMLPVSASVWAALPMAAFVQYPWRLLLFAAFGLSLMASLVWRVLPARLGLYGAAVVIALTLWVNAEAFLPQYLYPATSSDFTTQDELRFRASRVSDEYLPQDLVRPGGEDEVVGDTIPEAKTRTVVIQDEAATRGTYDVVVGVDEDVVVRRAYFPGWRYWVDGSEGPVRFEGGLPVVRLTAGTHTIEIRLADTPVRKVANLISLLSAVFVLYLYAKHKKAIT